MLSYQHSFHAGNHADVIKHITLVGLLERLSRKNKAFFYLDTHAGNGVYQTMKSEKHDELSAKMLLDSLRCEPSKACSSTENELASYLDVYAHIIAPFCDDMQYPGSPIIAKNAIDYYREKRSLNVNNNLQLSELHPSSFDALKNIMKQSQFQLHKRSGFELLNASMPPTPNRGLVLIDPPYEQIGEYNEVRKALSQAYQKWPQGVFAIWYPLLSATRRDRISQKMTDNPKHGMSEKLIADMVPIAERGLLNIRYAHCEPSNDIGMYGSGMLIVNPPYEFDKDITATIAVLQTLIQQDKNKLSAVEYLVPPV